MMANYKIYWQLPPHTRHILSIYHIPYYLIDQRCCYVLIIDIAYWWHLYIFDFAIPDLDTPSSMAQVIY